MYTQPAERMEKKDTYLPNYPCYMPRWSRNTIPQPFLRFPAKGKPVHSTRGGMRQVKCKKKKKSDPHKGISLAKCKLAKVDRLCELAQQPAVSPTENDAGNRRGKDGVPSADAFLKCTLRKFLPHIAISMRVLGGGTDYLMIQDWLRLITIVAPPGGMLIYVQHC